MKRYLCLAILATGLSGCGMNPESQQPKTTPEPVVENTTAGLSVPVHYRTLENGLKVVVSPDQTAPIVAIGVYYNIGFRIEPQDRTGFAHLFEHMMFQGSENLPKGQFDKLVNGNGGISNGSTRFDFTNYYEIVPSHTLETFLWVEADRMKGLNITQEELTNQQGVVKNEVKVNVLNRPYGGFPWLFLPQYAFDNWYNAHNFYGDLEDLDAASLEDVSVFFDQYYAPNNAALVIVGDVDVNQTFDWIEQYFADIPKGELKALPDISELPQTKERIVSQVDPLAPKPAYAVGYRMPERNSPEYYAMGLIDQILLQGDDSLLHQSLVAENAVTSGVWGGVNALGNMFNYNGPILWSAAMIHEPNHSSQDITALIDEKITQLQNQPVTPELLNRARVKLRSELYDTIEGNSGVGKVDLLACFALFDNDPARINEIEAEFAKVTPELIQKTAQAFLVKENRTVFSLLTANAELQQGE